MLPYTCAGGRAHGEVEPDQVRALDAHGRAREWGHEGTAAWFAGIEDGCCHFGIAEERISDLATVYLEGGGAGADDGVGVRRRSW